MKKQYGVAIIGCGHMGHAHMEKIYFKQNVRFVCACDLDLEKANDFGRHFCAQRVTQDAASCIADPEVDIVIIATYPSTHLEYLKLCIQYKKHVLCEKPITSTEKDGDHFMQLVQENPEVKVLVGYILRHNRSYQKIAHMIHCGAIGSPIILRMVQNHNTIDWKKYRKLILETSPIVDCGVHYLDVMRWFTGSEISHISGVGLRTENDLPEDCYNYGIITVRLSDGSAGYYEAGWSNTISSENLKEFVGPKGHIRLVCRKDRPNHQEEGDLIEYYRYPEKTYEMINIKCERKPTGDQFDHLVRMIEEGVPAVPSIEDVFKSFQSAFAADKVIRGNMWKGVQKL
jgi:predicted dehydrogenase